MSRLNGVLSSMSGAASAMRLGRSAGDAFRPENGLVELQGLHQQAPQARRRLLDLCGRGSSSTVLGGEGSHPTQPPAQIAFACARDAARIGWCAKDTFELHTKAAAGLCMAKALQSPRSPLSAISWPPFVHTHCALHLPGMRSKKTVQAATNASY